MFVSLLPHGESLGLKQKSENACGCCETWGEQIQESVWCGPGPDDGRESEPYSAFPGASSLPEHNRE